MKRALLAATALLSSTIISSPAFAVATDTPTAAITDGTTTAAMQSQCNVLAAAHDTGNGDIWTAAVVVGAVSPVSGPTETGTRNIDQNSIQGTGIYVPSVREIRGVPFKNGGSVNLFGDQWATAGYYPGSTYNYTASFNSAFAHAFSCDISDAVYHPAVFHPAVVHDPVMGPGEFHPAVAMQGCYTNPGHSTCTVDTHWCNAEEATHWGVSYGNCVWHELVAAQDAYTDPDVVLVPGYTDPAYTDPAYNDPPAFVVNEAGNAVNQDQTDTLNGFEANGPLVQVTAEYHVGQPVICNSPGSKGGSWKPQNGYGGGSLSGAGTPAAPGCNTPYFKIAPTYNGSTTSNGTFTSVPNYHL
jgi:hypothetical protein